jgi:hypothetical protein
VIQQRRQDKARTERSWTRLVLSRFVERIRQLAEYRMAFGPRWERRFWGKPSDESLKANGPGPNPGRSSPGILLGSWPSLRRKSLNSRNSSLVAVGSNNSVVAVSPAHSMGCALSHMRFGAEGDSGLTRPPNAQLPSGFCLRAAKSGRQPERPSGDGPDENSGVANRKTVSSKGRILGLQDSVIAGDCRYYSSSRA